MRIADNMNFEQVNRNLAKTRSDLVKYQNQAATQKSVTRPSDDPVAASRVLATRVGLQALDQHQKNLNYAKSFLEFTDQSLGEVTEYLVRAKELMLSQASDGAANEETRRVVAEEMTQIFSQIVKVGNRQLGDRFIFGGFRTLDAPFSGEGKYLGDRGEMLVGIDKGTFLSMNVPGIRVFQGVELTGDGIVHTTATQARTLSELQEQLQADQGQEPGPRPSMDPPPNEVEVRGPAAVEAETSSGVDVFQILRRAEIALRANDKAGAQDVLEDLDQAIHQVVLARAQVGSRVAILNQAFDTLQKQGVDHKALISQLEDADTFQVISDINKTEGTLQATLQTSGKLLMPSLLDFLR